VEAGASALVCKEAELEGTMGVSLATVSRVQWIKGVGGNEKGQGFV